MTAKEFSYTGRPFYAKTEFDAAMFSDGNGVYMKRSGDEDAIKIEMPSNRVTEFIQEATIITKEEYDNF